eukprot:9482081-Pyramimonas_sp.AAC.1
MGRAGNCRLHLSKKRRLVLEGCGWTWDIAIIVCLQTADAKGWNTTTTNVGSGFTRRRGAARASTVNLGCWVSRKKSVNVDPQSVIVDHEHTVLEGVSLNGLRYVEFELAVI